MMNRLLVRSGARAAPLRCSVRVAAAARPLTLVPVRAMAGHAHHEHFDAPAADKIWRPKAVAPFTQPISEKSEFVWPDATGPEPLVDNWEHVPISRAAAVWTAIMGSIFAMWYFSPNEKPKIRDHRKVVMLGPDRDHPTPYDKRAIPRVDVR